MKDTWRDCATGPFTILTWLTVCADSLVRNRGRDKTVGIESFLSMPNAGCRREGPIHGLWTPHSPHPSQRKTLLHFSLRPGLKAPS